MKLETYPDMEMLAIDLASRLADDLAEALQHKDRICFAVPGGTSPGPVFDDLCAAELDWSRIDVVLTDERWVDETHERSNARLIKQRLLVGPAAVARYLPLYVAAAEPEDVLAELESIIVPELPIDVLLLGMGADMHTASLFPDSDGLEEALDPHAPILVPIRRKDLPEPRVTLSARVLNGALRKHLLISGIEKKNSLDAAHRLPHRVAPVRAVLDEIQVHWAKK